MTRPRKQRSSLAAFHAKVEAILARNPSETPVLRTGTVQKLLRELQALNLRVELLSHEELTELEDEMRIRYDELNKLEGQFDIEIDTTIDAIREEGDTEAVKSEVEEEF